MYKNTCSSFFFFQIPKLGFEKKKLNCLTFFSITLSIPNKYLAKTPDCKVTYSVEYFFNTSLIYVEQHLLVLIKYNS